VRSVFPAGCVCALTGAAASNGGQDSSAAIRRSETKLTPLTRRSPSAEFDLEHQPAQHA
jgi:hypothetical protein